MVNIGAPQLRRPRSNMTPVETSRTCYACKKLFCCVECRERHEKKRHAERVLNCPLCNSQKLPLRAFEDNLLLCHIVITHLPLYCYLCGEIFRRSKDLESHGTCKWWTSRHRHYLFSEQKSVFGTPPSTLDGKEPLASNEYNGNFAALTSPPELYRNTSTPMIAGQKTNLDFKTPNVPNFSLKTPKASSMSLKTNETRGTSTDENSQSNYVSFPTSTSQEETSFRSLSIDREEKDDLPRSNARKLDVAREQEKSNSNRRFEDNNAVEDMELTGVEGEVLPDSQSLEVQASRRSDSVKKVRFSDQFDSPQAASTTSGFNMTENEEYFEACDTLSGMQTSLQNSQIKIYEENLKNTEKENRSPDRPSQSVNQQSSGSSRVVMMVVMENNSTMSTSELIDSGLQKLGHMVSNPGNLSTNSRSSPGCSGSVSSRDSYYSVTSHNCYSMQSETCSPFSRSSNSSSDSNESSSSGGILSAVANVVRTVMKNFAGATSSRSIEMEQVSQRNDFVPIASTSETLNSMSSLASSLLRRPGKRPRDTVESPPSSHRQVDLVTPHVELRSPIAKRPRGWYRIKGREPIARMRESRITSPRGVSSETQVFHQGSLSVGDTILPLPSRAHQSTQTD